MVRRLTHPGAPSCLPVLPEFLGLMELIVLLASRVHSSPQDRITHQWSMPVNTGVRQNVRLRICLFGNKPLPPPERLRLPPPPSAPPPSPPALGFKRSHFPTSAGSFTKVLFGNTVKNTAAYQQVELFLPPKV